MTEQDAINIARSYAERESLEVAGLHSVQRFAASQLPERLQNRNDFWIVRFTRDMPEGAVESPSQIMVEVDDTSGQTNRVDAL
ncbi:MAG: hypothetical protein ACYC6Y_24315 [Thermoguttaceae bacterium]